MAERAAFHESLTDINVYRRVKAGIVDGSLVYPGEIVYTDEDVALLEVNPLINPLINPLVVPLHRNPFKTVYYMPF